MTEFEHVLHERLAGDSVLRNMLAVQPEAIGGGSSIFPGEAPEESHYPFVVFYRSGGGGDDTDRRSVSSTEVYYSFKVVVEGEDPTPAEEANERIYELLRRERFALLNYTVGTARRVAFITDTQSDSGRYFQVRGARYRWLLIPRYRI